MKWWNRVAPRSPVQGGEQGQWHDAELPLPVRLAGQAILKVDSGDKGSKFNRRITCKYRSGGVNLESSRMKSSRRVHAFEAPDEIAVSAVAARVAYGPAMQDGRIQLTPPPPPRVLALATGR